MKLLKKYDKTFVDYFLSSCIYDESISLNNFFHIFSSFEKNGNYISNITAYYYDPNINQTQPIRLGRDFEKFIETVNQSEDPHMEYSISYVNHYNQPTFDVRGQLGYDEISFCFPKKSKLKLDDFFVIGDGSF